MKTFKHIFVALAILLLAPLAAAHESNQSHEEPATATETAPQLPSSGITPDSPLFGLDRALEKLRLLLAFSDKGRAKAGLENAAERIAEARAMIEKKKIDAATKAREEHKTIVSQVKKNIAALAAEGSPEEIKLQVEIEKEIEGQEEAVEELERKIKIKTVGDLTSEQQAAVDALITAFQNQNGELKIEIKNKKDATKIKIKQKTGKTEKEIEAEIKKIEDEKGINKLKESKATKQISDAETALAEAEKELSGFEGDITAAAKLLEDAKDKLASAQFAKDAGKFGEAFGQARAAEALIKNAKRLIGKTEEKVKKIDVENKKEIKKESTTPADSKDSGEGHKNSTGEAEKNNSGGSGNSGY